MLRIFFTLCISVLLVGCCRDMGEIEIVGPQYVDYFPVHDDGCPKPRVALVPFLDQSRCCVPWDICHEFTDAFRYQAMCNGNLYLLPQSEIDYFLCGTDTDDYFSCNLEFAQRFCDVDFVVIAELIDHSLVPITRGQISPCYPASCNRCNTVLQMKLRLRVIDVRCNFPKILLQEIFTSNCMIPWEGECVNYDEICWGNQLFPSTPWGIGHKRMIRDLVSRVETVTWSR